MIEQKVAYVTTDGTITAIPPGKPGSGKVTDNDLQTLFGPDADISALQSLDKEVMSPTGLPFTARVFYLDDTGEKNPVVSEFLGEDINGNVVVSEVRLNSACALNGPRYERLQSIAARHTK